MTADLHTHSTCSDGSDDPEVVVAKAVAAGVSTLALTDHDNVNGVQAAAAAAEAHGVDFIPGTEISVDWLGKAMHLLVYFLEPGSGPLQAKLVELQQGRHDRNVRMVSALQDQGFEITFDEVAAEAKGQGVGRPHIAAVLIAKGVVPDIPTAFDQYLARGRPAYQERYRLSFDEAVDLARASIAVPVVAHPHTVADSAEEFSQMFRAVADQGVLGIECHYAEYAPDLRQHLVSLADSLGLVPTGGSDYHGTYKPDVNLVTGRGDLAVPEAAVDALRMARENLENTG